MSWAEVFVVFFVSHLVGDYLFQTDQQARLKRGGLGSDPEARRALFSHVFVYTLAFVPALIWIGNEQGPWVAVLIAAIIALPHLVIDDGRFVKGWVRIVKRSPEPFAPGLVPLVDQSFHLVCLWAAAMLTVALG